MFLNNFWLLERLRKNIWLLLTALLILMYCYWSSWMNRCGSWLRVGCSCLLIISSNHFGWLGLFLSNTTVPNTAFTCTDRLVRDLLTRLALRDKLWGETSVADVLPHGSDWIFALWRQVHTFSLFRSNHFLILSLFDLRMYLFLPQLSSFRYLMGRILVCFAFRR